MTDQNQQARRELINKITNASRDIVENRYQVAVAEADRNREQGIKDTMYEAVSLWKAVKGDDLASTVADSYNQRYEDALERVRRAEKNIAWRLQHLETSENMKASLIAEFLAL